MVICLSRDSISSYDVISRKKMARDSMPAVLMVAEKPSIAKSVAGILSHGQHSTNQSPVCKKCPVHEFTGQFMGSSARMKVTSVLGHVLKVEFDKEYRNWTQVDPVSIAHDMNIITILHKPFHNHMAQDPIIAPPPTLLHHNP